MAVSTIAFMGEPLQIIRQVDSAVNPAAKPSYEAQAAQRLMARKTEHQPLPLATIGPPNAKALSIQRPRT
ncbi:MAG TPA: hypothetical protein VFY73_13990 [Ideonella sp.]|uniref:hypothetical protein n=1 Tax=Ideonella sp. TaxID=1929293 RepID=UPI002E369E46|nr:hypothetical protein [Ideonella sp.]HEX5685128.1 hypothetical protein [Ideonella sp.]